MGRPNLDYLSHPEGFNPDKCGYPPRSSAFMEPISNERKAILAEWDKEYEEYRLKECEKAKLQELKNHKIHIDFLKCALKKITQEEKEEILREIL